MSTHLADGRRIEVLANGLPFWQGALAAIDTALSRQLRGRAACSHMPIVSPARRLSRRRNANASTHSRSLWSLLQISCARPRSWRQVRPRGRGLLGQGSCARIPRAVALGVQHASLHRW